MEVAGRLYSVDSDGAQVLWGSATGSPETVARELRALYDRLPEMRQRVLPIEGEVVFLSMQIREADGKPPTEPPIEVGADDPILHSTFYSILPGGDVRFWPSLLGSVSEVIQRAADLARGINGLRGGLSVVEGETIVVSLHPVREFVNATPHPVSIVDADGNVTQVIPPSGPSIRVETRDRCVGRAEDGTPIYAVEMGDPIGLPEPRPGVVYVVSRLVRDAAPDRSDLVVPFGTVRDEEGRVIGCRGFAR